MLENMFVKNVDDRRIEISVRNRDYGKLRGAEEGVFQKQGKKGGYRKTLVKRPFFHLSKNDIEAVKSDPAFQRTLDLAAQRLAKAELEK